MQEDGTYTWTKSKNREPIILERFCPLYCEHVDSSFRDLVGWGRLKFAHS